MDIVAEIAVWGVIGILITIAFGATLPAFFRMMRDQGLDLSESLREKHPDAIDPRVESKPSSPEEESNGDSPHEDERRE
jgi:hypothetical protein